MPGPGFKPGMLHLSVTGSIPGPGTWKIIYYKIVEDEWALQVNGTEINWKLRKLMNGS